ncbi:hypothetical protein, partial [Klebsiella pneumoniae]|uniref:hypothetical protein n=1 Tax=Klebsiella pneumoniae TaxID=573 RepID=UPI0040556385
LEFKRRFWQRAVAVVQSYRETKKPYQSNGQYAAILLAKFNQITEKMRETVEVGEVEARMAFLSLIVKVQLARDTGHRTPSSPMAHPEQVGGKELI